MERVRGFESYSSTVVFVKGVEWMLEVGGERGDGEERMKRIVRALEDAFGNLGEHSLASHILIIGFKGNTIKFDMTKNATLTQFEMTK